VSVSDFPRPKVHFGPIFMDNSGRVGDLAGGETWGHDAHLAIPMSIVAPNR